MSNLLPAQKTTFTKNEEIKKDWLLVDAKEQILGRIATRIAFLLLGKHKTNYAPHQDTGDFVVVINAGKLRVTGNKMDQKLYHVHSNYPGGLKSTALGDKMVEDPTYALMMAVKRMLPKGALGRKLLTHVKIFAGEEHTHQAQKPKVWDIKFR